MVNCNSLELNMFTGLTMICVRMTVDIRIETQDISKGSLVFIAINANEMSQCMRFPTMWYVGPAKPQISLHICAV